jgi:hypothetical protein
VSRRGNLLAALRERLNAEAEAVVKAEIVEAMAYFSEKMPSLKEEEATRRKFGLPSRAEQTAVLEPPTIERRPEAIAEAMPRPNAPRADRDRFLFERYCVHCDGPMALVGYKYVCPRGCLDGIAPLPATPLIETAKPMPVRVLPAPASVPLKTAVPIRFLDAKGRAAPGPGAVLYGRKRA